MGVVRFFFDEKGQFSEVEIIDQSEFRDVEGYVKTFLSNLTYSPAVLDGKQSLGSTEYFYRFNYSKATIVDPKGQLSKKFYDSYTEINRLFKQKQFDKADEALDSVAKYNVDNLMEQGLYYWQRSQLHYQSEDWQAYGELMRKVYYLSPELPDQIAFMALQNAIDWLLFDKNYALAYSAFKRLLSNKTLKLDDKSQNEYREIIEAPLNAHTEIQINKSLALGSTIYQRRKGSVKELSGEPSKLELRCGNVVIKLKLNKHQFELDISQYKTCRIHTTANSALEFTLLQTE